MTIVKCKRTVPASHFLLFPSYFYYFIVESVILRHKSDRFSNPRGVLHPVIKNVHTFECFIN